jgi:hypothetical protein
MKMGRIAETGQPRRHGYPNIFEHDAETDSLKRAVYVVCGGWWWSEEGGREVLKMIMKSEGGQLKLNADGRMISNVDFPGGR